MKSRQTKQEVACNLILASLEAEHISEAAGFLGCELALRAIRMRNGPEILNEILTLSLEPRKRSRTERAP
jgi:hypothetical protein